MAKRKASPKAAKAETKADKFLRLAKKRVTKALRSIESIGKLGNRNSYEYTPAQISAIENALKLQVKDTVEEFSAKAVAKDRDGFEF